MEMQRETRSMYMERNSRSITTFVLKVNSLIYVVSLFNFATNEELSFYSRVAFFLLLLSFLPFSNRVLLVKTRALRVMIPFLVLVFANNIWAFDKNWSLHRTVGVLFYFSGAYLIYVIFLEEILPINHLLWALCVSDLVMMISSLYQFLTLGAKRVAGLAGNANTYGASTVFICFILYYFYNISRDTKNMFINILIHFSVLTSVVISGSRQTLLLALVFYICMCCDFLIRYKLTLSRIISIILLSGLILITVTAFYQYIFAFMYNNIYSFQRLLLGTQEASARIRTELIKIGLNLFVNKPIFGYGLDNFRPVSGSTYYPHNTYIDLLVSLGILGLISYYLIYFDMFYLCVGKKNRMTRRQIYCIMFMILSLFLNDLFTVSINSSRTFFVLFLMYLMLEKRVFYDQKDLQVLK